MSPHDLGPAFNLLHLATERFPPPPGMRHNLTIDPDGRLSLSVATCDSPRKFMACAFDGASMTDDPRDIIAEIAKVIT